MSDSRPWYAAYDEGVPQALDVERVCMPEVLARTAQRFGDRPAVTFLNRTLDYTELDDAASRFAGALVDLGVEPGDRVAIQLPNVPQATIAFFGALRAGAVVVMTNPLYTLREVEHQWADADCKVAVTADFTWMDLIRENRARLRPEHYVVASIPEYLGFPLNWLAPLKLKKAEPRRWAKFPDEPGVSRFKKLVDRTAALTTPPELDFDGLALLQYTGGTTGASKGAMLTHANLSANVQQTVAWFTQVEQGREVLMTALPLFHVFGLTVCMNFGVWVGARLVLQPNPRDLPAVIKGIEKNRVTLFPSVPALFNALNEYAGIEDHDLRSIKSCFSGSAPIPPDVLRRFEELTGATIVEGFGMSETSPVTHCNPLLGERRIGTVGIPVSGTEAKVVSVDDGVTEMPLGEEGELVIAGPQVMQGYWQRPDETEKTLRDGWMHTGDLATIDAEGYFRIVGRMKDMINCGGLKVFPDEVDAVLMSHPDIVEAATIGVPDERRGETVKSFIVLRSGASLDEAAIEAFARENLAAYKIPREVEFLAELPKSTVMKVLRRELRDMELKKRGG